MIDKLALKRLTASDLTFFEWHFKYRNAGNQKAINLNADVLTGQLYPSLDIIAQERQNRLGVDLWIAGPAAAEPVNLQRKIIKGTAYKNWRLDGEFVYNTDEQPDRFNVLAPDDVALFGFEGELAPDTVTLVLVASAADADKPLFEELSSLLGNQRMVSLDTARLRELCERLSISGTHPIWRLVTNENLIEAGTGFAPAIERLLKHPQSQRLSADDLRKARQHAEQIGQLGEALVDSYLKGRLKAGEISDYEWTSASNAIAPHDFRVERNGHWENLEIKTTTGTFDREYHLPRSEIQDMAYGGAPYRIGRVYDVTASGAKMRVSEDLRAFGQSILDALLSLPAGVALDGVAIAPDGAVFDPETVLVAPDPDEE